MPLRKISKNSLYLGTTHPNLKNKPMKFSQYGFSISCGNLTILRIFNFHSDYPIVSCKPFIIPFPNPGADATFQRG